MAIIALRAWYLEQYEPIREIIKKPCHLRLSRNSLLKSGLRADFLDLRQEVESSDWFGRYLQGETVEFYIEGSGNYAISNIDLVSQEIYFSKQESLTTLEPVIYFSPQIQDETGNKICLNVLEKTVTELKERSRLPLSLLIAPRPTDNPIRLSSSQLRKIRQSLLFVADGTPIATVRGDKKSHLLLSPYVCVELGYALESKDVGQILLLRRERSDLTGDLPFDVAQYKQLIFKDSSELSKTLPKMVKTLLQRFSLFS
jgi:hypothetical protein